MDIHEQRHGAVTVLRPQGPLCLADAENFARRMEEVLARSLGRFVVDASAIPYIDSQGLESLVKATEELAQSGRSLRLCGANETLREVLDLTDLADKFEYYEDVNTAVRSFL